MVNPGHTGAMAMAIVFIVLLLAGPASILFSPDTRDFDDRDRRGWWPGSSRR